jgi:hypothetical protein
LYRNGAADEFQSYWLYDVNAKINHRFADQSQLFVSLYSGQDFAPVRTGTFGGSEAQELLTWFNQTASVRYHRLLGKQVFWSSQLTASRYVFQQRYRETEVIPTIGSDTTTSWLEANSRPSLSNLSAQSLIDWYPGSGHQLQLGVQWDVSQYRPDALTVQSSEQGILSRVDRVLSIQEPQVWISDTWEQGSWQVQGGLRLHMALAKDSLFALPEPRLQIQWKAQPNWVLMGSWGIQRQFAHQLSATRLGLPGDVWVPASRDLPPQHGQQLSIGTLLQGTQGQSGQWEFSLETYYQTANQQVLYQPSLIDVGVVLGDNWQDRLLTRGQGRGYGAELFFRLNRKRFQFWAAYTLAWSEQRFPSLSQGNWQPGVFDQRHSFKWVGFFQLRKRWQASITWVLQSGRPIFLPGGEAPGPESSLPGFDFSEPGSNQGSFLIYPTDPQRFPLYHRMDLGLVFQAKEKRSWKLGAYNLYNQVNPLFLTVRPPDMGQSEGTVVGTGVLPFLPYVSYQWDF